MGHRGTTGGLGGSNANRLARGSTWSVAQGPGWQDTAVRDNAFLLDLGVGWGGLRGSGAAMIEGSPPTRWPPEPLECVGVP